jgi:hypothetical protein
MNKSNDKSQAEAPRPSAPDKLFCMEIVRGWMKENHKQLLMMLMARNIPGMSGDDVADLIAEFHLWQMSGSYRVAESRPSAEEVEKFVKSRPYYASEQFSEDGENWVRKDVVVKWIAEWTQERITRP